MAQASRRHYNLKWSSMEIEISESKLNLLAIPFIGLVVLLTILGAIGKPLTRTDEDGKTRVFSWTDWQVWKGERVYAREVLTLRNYVDDLADIMSDTQSSPVEAQILLDRISRNVVLGSPELEQARLSLLESATLIRNWSAGLSDRIAAEQSLSQTIELLK
jgi:hypothetical protein